jgi:hypothetical protein
VDDLWAWRADHGTGVGWTLNTANHGVVVNGDRVTALGLFVEHYQKEQVLWNGNSGETIFGTYYSFRSATMGSTPAARHAGITDASTAANASSSVANTSMTGSHGFTPNS